ncbi:helix-turn-helix domain-containing protein (plasmid) [Saccharothrix sp. AJ9571]|nr:helix-turn-helix domain-containing protein [Saccharothrix sp. AJ9571]
MSQEQLAEQLGVSDKTVQAWEAGRRSLLTLSYSRLQQLHRSLQALGARPDLLKVWKSALEVDDMLAGGAVPNPDLHPLAMVVPDRATTELLVWPISGELPRQLCGSPAALPVPQGQRDAVAAQLRRVADIAAPGSETSAMLRRQVKFLVAGNPASRSWLADQEHQDARRSADLRSWTPEWAVARSAAVTAAHAGDLGPLDRFIHDGLASEDAFNANLNYWAYWVGEYQTPWGADHAMNAERESAWSGELLLASLLDGVVDAPYRELCAHTLWALLRSRRRLATHPGWRTRIAHTVDRAMDADELGGQARRRLEQVHYLVGSD